MKPGKKEKIRFGRAPTSTLPNAPGTKTEDAGAGEQVASNAEEPVNPLETNAKPTQKTRYTARAKAAKVAKSKVAKTDTLAPAAPDAAEVADRQTQAAPLGLAGDTSVKKKKKATTTGDKMRMVSEKKKKKSEAKTEDTADVHGWW
jgi:peptidyl-prolyl cis-trans isomerase SurA